MVSHSLLVTKLSIPGSHDDEVPRHRLRTRIEEGLTRPLILVSAPAGSGKTTLVSAWASETDMPVAWLSLDEGDSDPVRFLTYATAALSIVASDLDASTSPLLRTPQPQPIEVMLINLINRLSEVQQPFVLVLDDYHLVSSPVVHSAFAFLLDHLPPLMHLILLTRADPPLPLARLRARGQLVELRAADLSFSLDESTALLTEIRGLHLDGGDIRALLNRTEGWAAGLQLAALSMQGRADLSSFVANFTGSHEYIIDYLVDEVVSQQPEAIRGFLHETSILDHLTGPLCDAITGRTDGAETLTMLERRNLFIVPLDTERQWFRYHRLFADVLQQRLVLTAPQAIAGLHRRASQWLAEHGYTVEAVRHALSTKDVEWAVSLVEQAAESLLMRSETATLLHWLEQLPEERVQAHSSLSTYYAWCLLLSGQPLEAVEAHLQDVEKSDPSMALPLRGFISFYQGRLTEAQTMAGQALKSLPLEQHFLRSVAQWLAEVASLMSMKLSDVDEHLFQIAFDQRTSPVMTVINLCYLAEIRMRRGQLHEAQSIYQQALSLAVDPDGSPLPIAGMARMGLGGLAFEWNDLESAEKYFVEGIELITRWGEIGALDGHLGLHLVERTRGNFSAARAQLQQAKELARRFDAASADDVIVDLIEARQWIAEGNLDGVAGWVEEHGLRESALAQAAELRSLSAIDYHLRHHELLTVVRFWMAQGKYARALDLLAGLLSSMEEHGWLGSRREIEVQILSALCLDELGQLTETLNALTRALDLAEPGGYVLTFVSEGSPMANLLHEAARRGIHPLYASRLLSAFTSIETIAPLPEPAADLIEPLSERELEVLHLMADGLSNREIAGRLYLATTTVKVHARNIFSKLDASNRTQAVAKGRALGLLQ